MPFLHHRIQSNKQINAPFAFLILLATSSSVTPLSHTTLPRTCSQLLDKNGVPVHAMKACKGIEVGLHSLLTLALDGGGVVSLTRRPLYPMGKIFRYPFEQEAGWAAEQVWTFWRRDCSWRDSNTRSSCSAFTVLRAIPASSLFCNMRNKLGTEIGYTGYRNDSQ